MLYEFITLNREEIISVVGNFLHNAFGLTAR